MLYLRYLMASVLFLFGCGGLIQAAELPVTAKLQYVDDHGLPVNMTFNQQDGHYSIQTDLNMIVYQLSFTSAGHMNQHQLIPESYYDRRSGKIYAQALFDGQKVYYGKASAKPKEQQLDGAVYDVFTLAWQLALSDGKLPTPAYLTNGKRIYSLEGIEYLGQSTYLWNKEEQLIHQYRLQQNHNTINYAFIPSLGNIPVQISYTDNDHVYVLKLKKAQLDGKVIQSQ